MRLSVCMCNVHANETSNKVDKVFLNKELHFKCTGVHNSHSNTSIKSLFFGGEIFPI